MNEYKIEYLQLFKDDLNDIVKYITLKLDNKPTAHKLVNEVQKKIELLKTNPEIYQSPAVSSHSPSISRKLHVFG